MVIERLRNFVILRIIGFPNESKSRIVFTVYGSIIITLYCTKNKKKKPIDTIRNRD